MDHDKESGVDTEAEYFVDAESFLTFGGPRFVAFGCDADNTEVAPPDVREYCFYFTTEVMARVSSL